MFMYRLSVWIVALIAIVVSISLHFEAYVATILAIVGTYYWVKGNQEFEGTVKHTPTKMLKIIRVACHSDSVMGGGLVGLSAALQGMAQIRVDFFAG